MNLAALLREQAARHPDRPAIIDSPGGKRRVTTFAALEDRAARAAAMLVAGGLSAGDRVLIFQPMSAELYTALAAVFRLGAVAVFLDPSAGRAHLERCTRAVEPRALIATAKAHLLRLVSGSLRAIPRQWTIGLPVPGARSWRCLEGFAPLREPGTLDPGDPALITFTSGSTGEPKVAVRTHGFLLEQYRSLCRTLELREGGVDLATLPIVALANLAAGVTSVIPGGDLRRPGKIDGAAVADQIVREGVESTAASPALLERLAAHAESSGSLPLARIYAGGAPVFPSLLDRLRRAAPKARLVAVYGSTEAEPIAELDYRELSREDRDSMRRGAGLLAGPPVPEIDLRILRPCWGTPLGPMTEREFDALCLPAGEPGEIVVAGPHVLPGYLGGRGDEETKIAAGARTWHRTGDCGRLDAAGRLWLLGRAAARLEDSRGVLYPFSVETALSFHPNVCRSALIGDGAKRVLFVEWADSPEQPAARLEDLEWAQLDQVRPCRKIPVDKRHNAKVDYEALRRLLAR